VDNAKDSNQVKMAGSDTPRSNQAAKSVSELDSRFMSETVNVGLTEVSLGKLASEESANSKVKSFVKMMVKDHTNADHELKKLASDKNITLPDSLSQSSRKECDDLKEKEGKAFDKAYIDKMVDGHEKVLNQFEDMEKHGTDLDLKAFVTKTIPVIKEHLDSAKAIQESLK
jgi:putative membrane protein